MTVGRAPGCDHVLTTDTGRRTKVTEEMDWAWKLTEFRGFSFLYDALNCAKDVPAKFEPLRLRTYEGPSREKNASNIGE